MAMRPHRSPAARLRERVVETSDPLVLPGVANALGARIVEDCGFEAVYLSGAGISNTFLGKPDLSFLTMSQIADHVAAVSRAVSIPLIVDVDTGFGNAVNVAHTVRVMEDCGASGIQLEDQAFPKKCGHFEGKTVISASEMVQKIRAAVESATDPDFLVIARTDSRATHGIDEACHRANLYREAGAQVTFVEAPESEREVELIGQRVAGPKVINYVEGGKTPEISYERASELGFTISLYANLSLLASVHAMQSVLGDLLASGKTPSRADVPFATWDERQRLVGLPDMLRLGERYAES